jgi:putative transposase
MRGGHVVVADRFYASSKTCSACGHKLETLPLSVRKWTCSACGSAHDRDVEDANSLAAFTINRDSTQKRRVGRPKRAAA